MESDGGEDDEDEDDVDRLFGQQLLNSLVQAASTNRHIAGYASAEITPGTIVYGSIIDGVASIGAGSRGLKGWSVGVSADLQKTTSLIDSLNVSYRQKNIYARVKGSPFAQAIEGQLVTGYFTNFGWFGASATAGYRRNRHEYQGRLSWVFRNIEVSPFLEHTWSDEQTSSFGMFAGTPSVTSQAVTSGGVRIAGQFNIIQPYFPQYPTLVALSFAGTHTTHTDPETFSTSKKGFSPALGVMQPITDKLIIKVRGSRKDFGASFLYMPLEKVGIEMSLSSGWTKGTPHVGFCLHVNS